MEENDDIDKIFRENLENFEAEPREKVWTSIAAELDEKKKPRGFGFLWIALLAALIGTGTFVYFNMETGSGIAKEKQPGTESSSPSESQHLIANTNAHVADQLNPSTEKIVAQSVDGIKETENSPGKKTDIQSSLQHETKPIAFHRQPVENKKESAAAHTRNAVVHNPSADGKVSTGGTEISNSSSSPRRNDESVEPSGVPAQANQPSDKVNHENKRDIDDLISEMKTENKNAAESNTLEPASVNNTNADAKKSAEENPEPVVSQNAATTNDSAVVNTPAQDAAPVPEKTGLKNTLKKIGAHAFIDLFYSPEYAVNRTSGTGNASESHSGYSWSSGLNIGYRVARKWSITAGANYSYYARSEMYSSIYVTSDSAFREMHDGDHDHGFEHEHGGGGGGSHGGGGHGGDHDGGPGHDGSHYVVHTSSGDIDLGELPPQCTGDEDSGDTLSMNTDVHSAVEFVNIPVQLRFNFNSRKLGFYVEAGASMGFIVNSNSKINIGSYSESNAVSGLTNFNYSALLNLGVEYRIYKGLSLFLAPGIRYSLTPINDSGSEKSYPYFVGGNAGLSIHF